MRQPSQTLGRLLAFGILCSTPLWLSSCQHTPKIGGHRPIFRLPPILTPPILHLPDDSALPPMSTAETPDDAHPPTTYIDWLQQHDPRLIEQYRSFLRQHHVKHLPPMYQMLTSARDWKICGREQYGLPPEELWAQMIPTLHVLDELQEAAILTDFEVTSTYRDPELNACAKGSLGSKHLHNAAIDIRLLRHQANPDEKPRVHQQLCAFWLSEGARHHLGLGLYGNGQIHFDTEGYRTWGPDRTRDTSLCAVDLSSVTTAAPIS
jgi:hypothetical protein